MFVKGATGVYIDGLMHDCGTSIALAMEIPQSRTTSFTCTARIQGPYKPCHHNLYTGMVISHIDYTQSIGISMDYYSYGVSSMIDQHQFMQCLDGEQVTYHNFMEWGSSSITNACIHHTGIMPRRVNSLRPGDAYNCQCTGSWWVLIMARLLFGHRPLPEPMVTYCQLGHWWRT